MSSTNSPTNTQNTESSCSFVSSLFPISCRGKAEAFARSLHRRLSTLSGENNIDDDSSQSTENTWLNSISTIKTEPTSSNFRTSHQHQFLVPSCETNSYYDFNSDFYEDQTKTKDKTNVKFKSLLMPSELSDNKEVCNCENNEKIKRSNIQMSEVETLETSVENDESDVHFDLLSSDSEKNNERFFDPYNTSDSETSTHTQAKELKFNCNVDATFNRQNTDDSSECTYPIRIRKRNLIHNSKNYLVTKNYKDISSPSHESLWSDDTTVSLPEDNLVSLNASYDHLNRFISKSFSDSQIFIHANNKLFKYGTKCKINEKNSVNNFEKIKSLSTNDIDKFIISMDRFVRTRDSRTNNLIKSNASDALKWNNFKLLRNKITDVTNTDETYQTDDKDLPINIKKYMSTCSTVALINDCRKESENLTKMKKTSTQLYNKLDINNGNENDNIDDQRPPRVRRCSSLKMRKTPPSTPCHKKIVRFADVLGLDLADVRTFLDEIPKVPNSAYSDLIYDNYFQKDVSPVRCKSQTLSGKNHFEIRGGEMTENLDRTLIFLFQQPGGLPNFLDKLRSQFVCLENVLVQDYTTFCIHGTVRVLNLDFHKSVHIRYTLNSWNNYSDQQAIYIPNSCDGLSDKFSFIIYCHTLEVGQRLEFAVRFQCKGMQFWDNNNGDNYIFQCVPTKEKNLTQ